MSASFVSEPTAQHVSPEVSIALADGRQISSSDQGVNEVLSAEVGAPVSLWPQADWGTNFGTKHLVDALVRRGNLTTVCQGNADFRGHVLRCGFTDKAGAHTEQLWKALTAFYAPSFLILQCPSAVAGNAVDGQA